MTLEIQPRVSCQKLAWIYLKIHSRCWIWTCWPRAAPFLAGRGMPWWQAACPESNGGRPRQRPARNRRKAWTWGRSAPGPPPTPAPSLPADTWYSWTCSLGDCIVGSPAHQADLLPWLEPLKRERKPVISTWKHLGSPMDTYSQGENGAGFPTLTLWTSRLVSFSWGRPHAVPCKMFSSIPGPHHEMQVAPPHPTPKAWCSEMSPDIAKCPSWVRHHLWLRTTEIE